MELYSQSSVLRLRIQGCCLKSSWNLKDFLKILHCLFYISSRPAFAPLYANQYSHHSSSSGATPTAVVPSVASSAAGLNNVMGSTGLLTPGSAGSATTPGAHMFSTASPYLNSANIAMGM